MFQIAQTTASLVLLTLGLAVGITPDRADALDPPLCHGLPATMTGSAEADTLYGTSGDDVIVALDGADVVFGKSGNDVLCGGGEADDLFAGPGNDAVFGENDSHHSDRGGNYSIGDVVVGGPGDDTLDGGFDPGLGDDWSTPDRLSFASAPQGVTVNLAAGTAVGAGTDALAIQPWIVIGSTHDDHISGSPLADAIEAGDGADIVIGLGGDDYIEGDYRPSDKAADVLDGGDGADALMSRGGDDRLLGGAGADDLRSSGGGPDEILGGDDDDQLSSYGHSADVLAGGDGDDHISDVLVAGGGQKFDGGAGNDSMYLMTWFVFNGEQQDPAGVVDLSTGEVLVDWYEATSAPIASVRSLFVDAAGWTLVGTDASEYLGASGEVTIHAGAGDDTLRGGYFSDVLDGGSGTDTADPGRGIDTCISIEDTPNRWDLCDPTPDNDLVSAGVASAVGESNGYTPSVSREGRYVSFQTRVALVPKDTNDALDVYVRDRVVDRVFRVSVRSDESEIADGGREGAISPDGRYVAFVSRGRVVPQVADGPPRIYLRDLQEATTRLISIGKDGEPTDGKSWSPSVSAGGQRIAFLSSASNLPSRENGVFVRDRQLGRTLTASQSSAKDQSNGWSYSAEITADGERVLFYSEATNLTATGRSGFFVRNLEQRTTSWVTSGSDRYEYYTDGSISTDGRYVAFAEPPADCLPQWRTDCVVVRVIDRRSGLVETISKPPGEEQAKGVSILPTLSADGRYVAFTSTATNLVPDDTNMVADVFVVDRETDRVVRASLGPALVESNGASDGAVVMSSNSRWLVYSSKANNLVLGDTNGVTDLFARDWATGLFG